MRTGIRAKFLNAFQNSDMSNKKTFFSILNSSATSFKNLSHKHVLNRVIQEKNIKYTSRNLLLHTINEETH